MITRLLLAAAIVSTTFCIRAEDQTNSVNTLLFDTSVARLLIDTRGGDIGEFRLKRSELNPLNWAAPTTAEFAPHAFGHFLCLDRWGPPSEAEGKRGMPYHGEASNVRWTVQQMPVKTNGMIEGIMNAKLPLAGLSVRRTIRMSPQNTVFTMLEEVTNDRALGRIFNMVQHATIAPPFLDETTIVSCNAGKGFAQGGTLPNPEEPSADWPKALKPNGQTTDLRRFRSDPEPNVVLMNLMVGSSPPIPRRDFLSAIFGEPPTIPGSAFGATRMTENPWPEVWNSEAPVCTSPFPRS